MKRDKYIFNQNTLSFEKLHKPFKRKLRDGLIYCSLLAVLFISVRLIFDDEFQSPKVNYFTLKNQELKESYNILNQEIIFSENILSDIQQRDDKLYRSVFDLEPIPSSVREAGFGGSEDYKENLDSRNTEFVTNTAIKLDKLSKKAKIQSVSLIDLFSKAKSQQALLSHKPSIRPISPGTHIWLTSSFGYRYDPFNKARRMHSGIDLAGRKGIKIYASGDGIVKIAELSRHGYGNEIAINHGFGYESIYAHLNKILVSKGDTITRGQLIGELGSTGRSTGPHLHYEIRFHNKAVNPMYYFYENLSPEEYDLITSVRQ